MESHSDYLPLDTAGERASP